MSPYSSFAALLAIGALVCGCRTASEPSLPTTPILFASTTGPTEDLAAISIDGRRVFAPSELMNAGAADWSPDGRSITFERIVDGRSQIFIGSLDGSRPPKQITQCLANCYFPRWSPDGRVIAYWYNYPPIGGLGAADSGVTLLVDTTGANPREIVPTRWRTSGHTGPPASWAPDSKRFAFARPTGDLYVVSVDGGDAVQVPTDGPVGDAAWSPDGSRIAAYLHDGGIGLFDPTGLTAAIRLDVPTYVSNDDRFPAWSPDGRQLVFSADGSGGWLDLFIMNIDGAGRRQLTSTRGIHEYGARWNPVQPR
jgi:TolB protein